MAHKTWEGALNELARDADEARILRHPNKSGTRYCVRCRAELHGTAEDQPHLCADVAARQKRRERMVNETLEIIDSYIVLPERNHDLIHKMGEEIVHRLLNLGIADADL